MASFRAFPIQERGVNLAIVPLQTLQHETAEERAKELAKFQRLAKHNMKVPTDVALMWQDSGETRFIGGMRHKKLLAAFTWKQVIEELNASNTMCWDDGEAE